MVNEKKVLEETLIELANLIWLYTLSTLKDEGYVRNNRNKHVELDIDPGYVADEARLLAYKRVLGDMLSKLSNSEYSLLINSLKLKPR